MPDLAATTGEALGRTIMLPMSRAFLPLALILLAIAPAYAEDPPVEPPPPVDPWTLDRPLSDATLEALDYALSAQLLTRADMGFLKSPIDDAFRLPEVQRTLDDPLFTYDFTWDVAKAFDTEDPLLPLRAATFSEWQGASTGVLAITHPTPRVMADTDHLGHRLWKLWGEHAALWVDCDFPEELRTKGLTLVVEGDEALAGPEGYKDFPDYARHEWLRMRQRSAWGDYVHLSVSLAQWAKALSAAHREAGDSYPGPEDWPELQVELPEWVTYVVGGPGEDAHTVAPGTLIIDPGGNDTYTFIDGVPEDALNHLIIDLGGNDRYLGDAPGSCGGGFLGTAIVVDSAGNDFYRTGPISQGAGLYGVGILIDESGTDVYEATDFVQGAGMFGLGLHFDGGAGNDSYRATLYGQGAALTGGLGICLNRQGSETYYAGGEHQDFPRWPEHTLSLSQGCAFGQRADASGGIAFLGDYAGNDIYTCEVYGQGVGYWYALGMLFDREGHDWYQLHQYGQGSGIHLASGALIDVSGIDRYNAWALAQGTGHDYATGVWLDMEGHDFMLGNDICQGIGHFNSVGLAIDLAGDDFWGGRSIGNNQGWVNPLRDFGGIGVLLDMHGMDVYNIPGHADGLLWVEPNGGVGYDLDAPEAIEPLLWLREDRMGKTESEGEQE